MRRITAYVCSPIIVLMIAGQVYAQGSTLESPLNPAISSIPTFIASALKILVMVALPIISLFIVYAGFMFVMARGNETALTKAKTNFVYVVIGAVLILGAWLIAQLLQGTVTQLMGGT